jgi:hypothetical protein
MSCECCHCCFCCCEQNYDNNPNDPKKPKIVPEPTVPVVPVTPTPTSEVPRGTLDNPGSSVNPTPRSIPIDIWPPAEPTFDEFFTPVGVPDGEDDYSFPTKSTPFEDDEPPEEEPPVITPPPTSLTPTYSETDYSGAERIDKATDLSQDVPSVTNQGPDPGWIGTTWSGGWGDWDGTPISIDGKTPSQICPLLFKNGYTMKGLRQLYYNIMPFADETAPTVAEIDAWNIEVIRHLRRLVGNTTPLVGDPRLYLEAQWADERRFTRVWDTEYPGTNGSAYGPCVATGNEHCGASFVPSFADQAPYLTQYPGLAPFNFIGGGAEGIGAVNTNVPWALKIVQRISQWVCSEGTTGHAGPFFTRTRVGMSFYTNINSSGVADTGTTMRVKWL